MSADDLNDRSQGLPRPRLGDAGRRSTRAPASSRASQYEEDIRQSILIILETAPGERVMRPNFGCGIHELVFAAIDSTATAADPLDGRGGAAPLRSAHRRAGRQRRRSSRPTRGQAARRDRVSRAQDEPDSATSSSRSTSAREGGREAAARPRPRRASAQPSSRRSCSSARAGLDSVVGTRRRRARFRARAARDRRALQLRSRRAARRRGREDAARLSRLARGPAARRRARRACPWCSSLPTTAQRSRARLGAGAAAGRCRPARPSCSKPRRTCASSPASSSSSSASMPTADAFYLPPPGLSESRSRSSRCRRSGSSRASRPPARTKLQLDPETGSRRRHARRGRWPAVPDHRKSTRTSSRSTRRWRRAAGRGSPSCKVTAFAPFDGAARNRQEHALYLGHTDLLNIEAAGDDGGRRRKESGHRRRLGVLGQGRGEATTSGWQPLHCRR